jgi:hypothetical protein
MTETISKENINEMIKSFVGKDSALAKNVSTFKQKFDKQFPELATDYGFYFKLIEMLDKVDGEVILNKINKYNKEIANKNSVKDLALRSLNLYMSSLGTPYNVFCIGKQMPKNTKAGKYFAGFTFILEENNTIGFFGVFDEKRWNKLSMIEPGKSYTINLTENGDNLYISKEPVPKLREGKLDTQKIMEAIMNSYMEINPNTFDMALEEKVGYIKAFAADVSMVANGKYTKIIPMFETESLMEDIPSEVVSILYGGATNIEEDDNFIAFGNFRRGVDKDGNDNGYSMFASAVLLLSEKEEPIKESDFDEDEDDFDMNATGEEDDETDE